MIVLGDQAPWTGGLLRLKAVQEAYPQEKVLYFLQDADCPWRQDGNNTLEILRGWVDYWSLSSRMAWAPSVPDHRLDSVMQTVGAPKGLSFIHGPKGDGATIFSQRANPRLQTLVGQLLVEEKAWAEVVADLTGMRRNGPVYLRGGSVQLQASVLADQLGQSEPPASLVKLFASSPPLCRERLPWKSFWYIQPDGSRREAPANDDIAMVPKGPALLIEFALRGWTTGCTKLPYVQQVQELRDQYYPNLMIPMLTISFNWQLPVDPLEAMIAAWAEKKRQRAEASNKPMPALPAPEAVEQIRAYWRGRPTAIGYLTLGGELNPAFENVVL